MILLLQSTLRMNLYRGYSFLIRNICEIIWAVYIITQLLLTALKLRIMTKANVYKRAVYVEAPYALTVPD
jgi:hypothetical protein